MLTWVLGNGQNIVAVLEILGFAVIGGFVFLGWFGGLDNTRRTESDSLADGLIKRQQQTIEQMGEDIKKLQADRDTQQKEIHVLQGQNEAYLKIITLRDPQTAKVFEEAPEIYQIARDTKVLAEKQLDAISGLTKAMEEFINRLPPLMPVMQP